MKLLEKLKNTFFEEEYVEVDESSEEERKENVAKKVETRETVKQPVEEQEEIEDTTELDNVINDMEDATDNLEEADTYYSDREILSKNNNLSYFDDDDFVDEYYEKKEETIVSEPKKIYGGSANSVYDSIINSEVENRPYSESSGKFHPTPIISPIYGVLDKNYRKEEVVDKKDRPSSYVSRRDVDLDSVRKKAYGDVSILDDRKEEVIEDTEPLLYDMIDTEEDTKPEVDKVTIADAEEYFEDLGLEYNVDYKDTSYEEATRSKTRSKRTEKHQDLEDDLSDTLTDLATSVEEDRDTDLDENLFDLVDSVYKEEE